MKRLSVALSWAGEPVLGYLCSWDARSLAIVSLATHTGLTFFVARLSNKWNWRAAPGYNDSTTGGTFGWRLASRVTAAVHAVVVTLAGASCFAGSSLQSVVWTAGHGARETAVMAFASGFFMQDFVYMALKEYDTMFMCHHATVLVFLLASHASSTAGRICALGLSMGEATNILQNTLWCCRAMSNRQLPRQFAIADSLKRRLVLPLFATAYGIIRLGLSPYASFLIISECWRKGGALNMIFAGLGACLNLGSFVWAKGLVRYVQRTYWPKPHVKRAGKSRDARSAVGMSSFDDS